MGFVREAIKTPKPLINVGFHQINFSKRLQRSSYIVCLNNEIKRKNLKSQPMQKSQKLLAKDQNFFGVWYLQHGSLQFFRPKITMP